MIEKDKNAWGIRKGSRVAVAMSGGVDSSVTALLLKEAGFDVFGVTMTLWSCHSSDKARKQTCCSTLDVNDARAVCERIGIPHVIADFRTDFRSKVIEQFADQYSQGRTPIPCIGCNQYFKFERLWTEMRDDHGAEYIATGHYAQIIRNQNGEPEKMLRGCDHKKDQSYYLFVMTEEQLKHSLFPLGHLTKPEVREIAAKYDLKTAQKPESFEICFVPDNDYAGFIEDYYPEKAAANGDIVDMSGNLLGKHRGTHAYTIGQRRGLGISSADPLYVSKIDAANNRLVVGGSDAIMSCALTASQFNWIRRVSVGDSVVGSAKIRAQHTPAACTITVLENNCVSVCFDEPQSAITPGQAFVAYDGEEVLGGGWID